MNPEFGIDGIDAIHVQPDLAQRSQHASLWPTSTERAMSGHGLRRVFDQVQRGQLAATP